MLVAWATAQAANARPAAVGSRSGTVADTVADKPSGATESIVTPPSSAAAAASTAVSSGVALSDPGGADRTGASAVGCRAPAAQFNVSTEPPDSPLTRVVACGSHLA